MSMSAKKETMVMKSWGREPFVVELRKKGGSIARAGCFRLRRRGSSLPKISRGGKTFLRRGERATSESGACIYTRGCLCLLSEAGRALEVITFSHTQGGGASCDIGEEGDHGGVLYKRRVISTS